LVRWAACSSPVTRAASTAGYSCYSGWQKYCQSSRRTFDEEPCSWRHHCRALTTVIACVSLSLLGFACLPYSAPVYVSSMICRPSPLVRRSVPSQRGALRQPHSWCLCQPACAPLVICGSRGSRCAADGGFGRGARAFTPCWRWPFTVAGCAIIGLAGSCLLGFNFSKGRRLNQFPISAFVPGPARVWLASVTDSC
jgi:hypothetical protein